MTLEDTAVMFESGWTAIDWVVHVGAVGVFVTVLCFARETFVWLYDLIDNWIVFVVVSALILGGSALGSIGFTYGLMRHSENQAIVWLVFGILAAVAITLGVRGFFAADRVGKFIDWAAALTVGGAATNGLISDAVTRAAAAVPTTVTAFVTGAIVAGAVAVVVFGRSRA